MKNRKAVRPDDIPVKGMEGSRREGTGVFHKTIQLDLGLRRCLKTGGEVF